MLTFWTAASAATITKVFGDSLKSFRPDVPEHRFIPVVEGLEPPVPQQGEVILVAGAKPLAALQKAGLAPKNRTVTSLREKPIKRGLGHFLVTFDPGETDRQPEKKEIVDWDVRLSHRLQTTGSMEPVVGDYKWMANFVQLIAEIEAEHAKTGQPVKVSFDSETMGLHPWYPDKDFVSISFTHRRGASHMLYLGPQTAPVDLDHSSPIIDQVRWLLTTPKIRMRLANGKYDLVWVAEKWGIECTNFKFDTLLVGSLVDENRTNSLNLHAKLLTDMGGYDDAFNDKFDKSKMEEVSPADLRVYQGGDTDACWQSAEVLQDQLLADPPLANFYVTILHPAARAFEKIERRGILIDQEKYAVLGQDLRKAIKEGEKQLLDLLPVKLKIKHRDRIAEQQAKGKSPLLPSVLKDYFFSPIGLNLTPKEVTVETKQPSMKKSHLRQFADNANAKQFVDVLTETDRAAKTLSTFVEGFLKHLRPDGCFHPNYMLFHGGFQDDEDDEAGTVTGRLSCKEPAFQTLPKKSPKTGVNWAKRIRECFIARKGKKLVAIDYSQGELRVVACLAPEPTMIASYEQNLDLHAVTGAKLALVELQEFLSWKDNEDKKLADEFERHRGSAKPANFGLIYGMQVQGFMNYCWALYGIRLSFSEAEKMRNAFFELYPGLLGYHEMQKELVKLHGMVRSPLGRIRHLPTIKSWDREAKSKAERQAINSPVQSCLADMMEWAIALIDDAYPNGEIGVIGNIHDALIAEVPEDACEEWAGRAINVMSNLPFDQVGWKPQLQFTADAEAGYDLANMKKIKFLKAA